MILPGPCKRIFFESPFRKIKWKKEGDVRYIRVDTGLSRCQKTAKGSPNSERATSSLSSLSRFIPKDGKSVTDDKGTCYDVRVPSKEDRK